MSSFTALNALPDEESDEEVDNTKEIQIEEALKLYQNAIKLHSGGKEHLEEAAEAYEQLFASDIFHPGDQDELNNDLLQAEAHTTVSGAKHGPSASSNGAAGRSDNLPSTLPHILYLSYRNRAQLKLDQLRNDLASGSTLSNITRSAASSALSDFAEALRRDEDDNEMWRWAARLSSALGSKLATRFCLETIVQGTVSHEHCDADLIGLEDAFAAQDLQQLITSLRDEPSINRRLQGVKVNSKMRKFADPLPYIPRSLEIASRDPNSSKPRSVFEIGPLSRSWEGVGKALLKELNVLHQGVFRSSPNARIHIKLEEQNLVVENTPKKSDHEQLNVKSPTQIQEARRESVKSMLPTEKQSEDAEPPNGSHQNTQGASAIPDLQGAEITTLLPVRKRNLSSAGLQESPDVGSRVRSKRLKARGSLVEGDITQSAVPETIRHSDEKLQLCEEADEWLFETINGALRQLNIAGPGSASQSRIQILASADSPPPSKSEAAPNLSPTLASDMYQALKSWDSEKGKIYLHGDPKEGLASSPERKLPPSSWRNATTTAFLEHAKDTSGRASDKRSAVADRGLDLFVDGLNEGNFNLTTAAVSWLESMLLPFHSSHDNEDQSASSRSRYDASSYLEEIWTEELKAVVVNVLILVDDILYHKMVDYLTGNKDDACLTLAASSLAQEDADDNKVSLTQTIFELHLDIYARITNFSSEVDQPTRLGQRDRLDRWANLSHDFVHRRTSPSRPITNPLVLRFLWAATVFSNSSKEAPKEHVIGCMQELKQMFQEAGLPSIHLPNNAVMSDLSGSAADREISRLTTMDFFLQLFNDQKDDPVGLIERLEPILDEVNILDGSSSMHDAVDETLLSDRTKAPLEEESRSERKSSLSPQINEFRRFLASGTSSLSLLLWKQLRSAYESIEYPSRVLYCHLRSLQIIIKELTCTRDLADGPSQRQMIMLKWLHEADAQIRNIVTLVQRDDSVFECIDLDVLNVALSTLVQLIRLFHGLMVFEDSVRSGQSQIPHAGPKAVGALINSVQKLRDMQTRVLTLLYIYLKEAYAQAASINASTESSLELLRSIHNALGLRSMCSVADKVFLKVAKSDLIAARTSQDVDVDLMQVLQDLYGFKFGAGFVPTQDHECSPEQLDRHTAFSLVDFVLAYVQPTNIKEVPKTDFKITIDKVQHAIGTPKAKGPGLYNLKIYEAFLKTSINPRDFYVALKGRVRLSTIPVENELAKVAAKGWFFLMGNLALSRFRSQKRVSPGPVDDLNLASAFFKLEFEFSVDRWETWYRQAQTYDFLLEDAVTWSADKLNNDRQEIYNLQRSAIHCYTMSLSTAARSENLTESDRALLPELYADFANRLYSTSRPPFGLEPFQEDNAEKFFSGDQGMYQRRGHSDLTNHRIWRFAVMLLRLAIQENSRLWVNHLMLGKCLWKIFQSVENTASDSIKVQKEEVLLSFENAINSLPKRKSDKQDPILEPHYKMIAVAHKMVERKWLHPAEGFKILQCSRFANHSDGPEDVETWHGFMLLVLKALGSADKANWHHRMVIRSARIHWSQGHNERQATAAKAELSPHIFTKMMVVQIWKPEFERPGRHFWYTSQYVQFFVKILGMLRDRTNLELLLKRVRKRSPEYYNHGKVWHETCSEYANLLRQKAGIYDTTEDAVFKYMSVDQFHKRAPIVDDWCSTPGEPDVLVSTLRDAVELKKINNNLMKGTLIDDVILDTYTIMYKGTIAIPDSALPEVKDTVEPKEERRNMMQVSSLLMSSDMPLDQATATQGAQAAKPRFRGVGRREIIRRAEGAVQKLSTAAPSVSRPSAREGERAPRTEPSADMEVSMLSSPRREEPTEMGVDSSPLGSLHDSLDEQSGESSDERGTVSPSGPKPLFPNLARPPDSKSASPGKATDDDDRDRGQEPGKGERNSGES